MGPSSSCSLWTTPAIESNETFNNSETAAPSIKSIMTEVVESSAKESEKEPTELFQEIPVEEPVRGVIKTAVETLEREIDEEVGYCYY